MHDGLDPQTTQKSARRTRLRRLLKLPVWRVGVALLGIASASVYVTALELDALLSQVFAAFAAGGAVMLSTGREVL